MGIPSSDGTRTTRFNLRATPKQQRLIRVAAQRQGLNVTDFILRSACEKAELTLTAETHFVLNPKQWDLFMKSLDEPPRVIPQIKKLFSKSPIAESR